MQKHLIIIGGVAAGAKAASKARKRDPDLKITIYTDGDHVSYSACALPYLIENVIKDPDKLLIRTPEVFKTKYNVNVHIRHKVTKIIPDAKKVEVTNLDTGNSFEDQYTKLIIATGAHPIKPLIEGLSSEGVFTLRSFNDGIAIKKYVSKGQKAVIIGAGYIGLEMVESFHNLGLDVTLIESSGQILPVLDPDMALQVQKYLIKEKNIKVIINDGVKQIINNEKNKVIQIKTVSGKTIDADIVLISVGVKPNIDIARATGIEIGKTGSIKVDPNMQTNIPDIYAAGDCVEQINIITGKPTWIPLGSTANKQSRIAAINATDGETRFKGVLGSHVSRSFDYTISGTGLTDKEAQKYNYDYTSSIITHRDKSGYFPGVQEITIKLTVDKSTRKILGAQIIGKGDADKRTNVIAAAIMGGMTIDEIADLDMTYAPPYSPVIDPIITTAHILINKLDKTKTL